MKFSADRIKGIFLHLVVFGLVFAGMLPTYFYLVVPVVLIGLPVAIFAKSKRAKTLAIAALMGYVAWIPIGLIYGKP